MLKIKSNLNIAFSVVLRIINIFHIFLLNKNKKESEAQLFFNIKLYYLDELLLWFTRGCIWGNERSTARIEGNSEHGLVQTKKRTVSLM